MNNKWELFQKFLITKESQISITDFLINAVVIIILSFILEKTYSKCAKSLSNRKMFASNFMIIAFTTMLIISIVKSSLALSLGLVGALSIVRFRAAIKEPEELGYLFFAISIGLGLGANQTIIVLIAFAVAMIIIWARYFLRGKKVHQNLFLTITNDGTHEIQLNEITALLNKVFQKVDLKRFDDQPGLFEASFFIDTRNPKQIQECKTRLREVSKDFKITFVNSNQY